MVDSLRYFAYFDDAGTERYAHLDESNYESTDLGFGQSITAAVFNNYANRLKPSAKYPLSMRYVLAQRNDADGRTVKRKFYVGAVSAPAWGDNVRTASIGGQTWSITAKVGEARYYAPTTDTNIIDGDVDNNVTAPP